MYRTISTLCLVSAAAIAGARAHDTWIDLVRRDADRVELALTSGMAFPAPDYPIEPARVAHTELRTAARRGVLELGPRGEHALALLAPLRADEAGVVTVELHPKELELAAEEVGHYLDELEASAEVRAAWAASGRWRERYRKVARVFLRRAGEPLPADLLGPTGLAFELSLGADPLTAGRLAICAHAAGTPLADQLVRVHGGAQVTTARTGPNGCAVIDAVPPKLLASAVRLRASREERLEWESAFATLVLANAVDQPRGVTPTPGGSSCGRRTR